MIRSIIIISILLILSCESTNTDKKDIIPINVDSILKSKPKLGFDEQNALLYKNFGKAVEDSDIKRVISIVKRDEIIDSAISINGNYFPYFCYMSPSAQLDRFVISSHREYPDSLKIISKMDKQFILEQINLNEKKEFKWDKIFDKVNLNDTFPEQLVSIPVFSLDKEKFIICVEKRNSKYCIHGKSWMYYKEKGKQKKIIFDSVQDCRKHISQ